MNVLMLTHRLPYAPNRGDRIRAYHLLRLLAGRHEVHLVSLVHDQREASHAADIRGLVASVSIARCSRMAGLARACVALGGGRPLTHVLLNSPMLPQTLAYTTRRQRPDVVLACGSGMARLALEPPLLGLPFVLDLVDVDSEKWSQYATQSAPPLRWVYRREARLLGAFEARAARAAFATLVVNERERSALHRLAPEVEPLVVPNGVDLRAFAPPAHPARDERVCFCGVMSYRPNDEGVTWFLRHVWPRVRSARPNALMTIVGAEPRRQLRRLADAVGGVEVTGSVLDVRPHLSAAAVFVAPLHLARGVQNKVLEAVAAGLPCVVTTAVRDGLPEGIAKACLVADDAEGFAAALLDLLRRPPLARRALAAGGDLGALGWPQQLARMPGLLEAAARSARVAQPTLRTA